MQNIIVLVPLFIMWGYFTTNILNYNGSIIKKKIKIRCVSHTVASLYPFYKGAFYIQECNILINRNGIILLKENGFNLFNFSILQNNKLYTLKDFEFKLSKNLIQYYIKSINVEFIVKVFNDEILIEYNATNNTILRFIVNKSIDTIYPFKYQNSDCLKTFNNEKSLMFECNRSQAFIFSFKIIDNINKNKALVYKTLNNNHVLNQIKIVSNYKIKIDNKTNIIKDFFINQLIYNVDNLHKLRKLESHLKIIQNYDFKINIIIKNICNKKEIQLLLNQFIFPHTIYLLFKDTKVNLVAFDNFFKKLLQKRVLPQNTASLPYVNEDLNFLMFCSEVFFIFGIDLEKMQQYFISYALNTFYYIDLSDFHKIFISKNGIKVVNDNLSLVFHFSCKIKNPQIINNFNKIILIFKISQPFSFCISTKRAKLYSILKTRTLILKLEKKFELLLPFNNIKLPFITQQKYEMFNYLPQLLYINLFNNFELIDTRFMNHFECKLAKTTFLMLLMSEYILFKGISNFPIKFQKYYKNIYKSLNIVFNENNLKLYIDELINNLVLNEQLVLTCKNNVINKFSDFIYFFKSQLKINVYKKELLTLNHQPKFDLKYIELNILNKSFDIEFKKSIENMVEYRNIKYFGIFNIDLIEANKTEKIIVNVENKIKFGDYN